MVRIKICDDYKILITIVILVIFRVEIYSDYINSILNLKYRDNRVINDGLMLILRLFRVKMANKYKNIILILEYSNIKISSEK